MINYRMGDLFESNAQTLVNTVNCVGVMGKGVALAFKKRFPAMFEDYKEKCHAGEVEPGKLSLYNNFEPWILNFPTKRHWKARSRIEHIELGLVELADKYEQWGITSIAMPALGCGHGGLDWKDVKALIEKYLSVLPIDIIVYEPGSKASMPEKKVKEKNQPTLFDVDKYEKKKKEDSKGN
jgi:O-acetyl-ADP-ribose deacetylase (regulator of RNase III)